MTRLSIYAAIALVIAGLLWNTDRLAKKVGEERYARKAAEGQVIAINAQRELDRKDAAELATLREQITASLRSFDETLRTSKATKEIRYVDKQGTETVCSERDPGAYRSLFNQATAGLQAAP